ncbi:MAG: O-antigen/teichoic acid export membrane protein [Halieaceae bacterium]|jgi:O-antigen/teichoic acid export membrane protein
MSLKHKTFSAVRWTSAAAGARALMQLAQLAVLARLLAPSDCGLMAIVTVVPGFANMFADMGVNRAYIQRQNVTELERSSFFRLTVGTSAVLSLLVLAFSSTLAYWFGDERLTPLLMLAAFTLVINALGQQIRINAEKALHFRPLVLSEIVATLLGFTAAITAAWAGWGVYALLAGSMISALGGTFLAWVFLADGWRPRWQFRLAEVRSYLGFGSSLVANDLVNEFNRNIDLVLGGRIVDTAALGLYSLPRQIVFQIQGMVNPIVTRPGFPLMAKVQTDVTSVREIYLKSLNMVASTNAPLYVGLAFFAPEVVQI